jgi:hypothetical protein
VHSRPGGSTASRWAANKEQKMIFGIMFIMVGIIVFVGAYINSNWINRAGNYNLFIKILGNHGRVRIFYMTFSILLIIFGILNITGISF